MVMLAVKGSQDADTTISRHSRALDSAWMLYAQDHILGNAFMGEYRMARWIVVAGGTYLVKGIGVTHAAVTFDKSVDKQGTFTDDVANGYPQFTVQLDAGAHRIDVVYGSASEKAVPSYVGFALYKGSESTPEIVSTPSDWVVVTSGTPEIGDEPNPTPAMNLPVWLLRPNWGEDVTETLEWKTDVLTSESGAEQRRKLRRFPRRYLEAQFVVDEEWQQIADSILMGVGKQPMLVPVMWDIQRLAASALVGESEIKGSFTNRLDYQPGKLAILIGADVMTYEVIAISGVSDDTLTLAYPLRKDWDDTCQIMPLGRALINDAVTNEAKTGSAGTYQIRWQFLDFLNVAANWGDLPVNSKSSRRAVTDWGSNWGSSVSFQIDRTVYAHDNEIGIYSNTDVGGNSTQMWSTSLMVNGVEEYADLVRRLYAMSGQLTTFHMPTDTVDLTLVEDINPNAGAIAVKPTGYTTYNAISQNIRQWIMIKLYDGTTHFTRVISTSVRQGIEYLFLEQTVGTIAMSDVWEICWCPIARLATDTVEIVHHTDIMGVCEASLAVVGFYDRRVAQSGQ